MYKSTVKSDRNESNGEPRGERRPLRMGAFMRRPPHAQHVAPTATVAGPASAQKNSSTVGFDRPSGGQRVTAA